jgi:hypothetical protein
MKSPEQFDFSKLKDQKKFDKLPKKEKDPILENQEDQAYRINEIIDKGEEKTLEAAINVVDLKDTEREIYRTIQILIDKKKIKPESQYNVYFMPEMLDILNKFDYSDLVKKYSKLFYKEVDKELSQKEINCEACFCSDKLNPLRDSLYRVGENDFLSAVREVKLLLEKASTAKFRSTCTSEISLEDVRRNFYVDILGRLQNAKSDQTIKEVFSFLENDSSSSSYLKSTSSRFDYEEKGNIENSIINNKKLSDEEKLDYLNKLTKLVSPTMEISVNTFEKVIKSRVSKNLKEEFSKNIYKEISINKDLSVRLAFLKTMAENNINFSYKEEIEKIKKESILIKNQRYSDYVELEIEKIQMALGEKRKDLGKGLQIEKQKNSSDKKIYLDGELICVSEIPQFSNKPTNGKIVSWLESQVMDRNIVTGTQNQDNIYAWKKGLKEPRRVFEKHGWSNTEEYFLVSAPEVKPDGTISVKVKTGEKIKILEFKI